VAVHVGGEVREILPAIQLGAIVERQHHELWRPSDLRPWFTRLRARSHRRHACQHGENPPKHHIPPHLTPFPPRHPTSLSGSRRGSSQLTLRARSRTRATWN